jgi:hypothetical protein
MDISNIIGPIQIHQKEKKLFFFFFAASSTNNQPKNQLKKPNLKRKPLRIN